MSRDRVAHVVLSGCSGGGKSSLLAELGARGFAIVPEPGRRIVETELRGDGRALPWVDLAAFARRAIILAREDRRLARAPIFYDRGLIDAMAALDYATGEPILARPGAEGAYHRQVFMTPPWPEIYVTDPERHHDLQEAIAEYDRLLEAYARLGYETVTLPKVGVAERADFVLKILSWRAGRLIGMQL